MRTIKDIFHALSERERLLLFIAILGAAVSAVSLGVYLFHRATVAVPAAGGTYVEGIVGQPVFINPVTAESETDQSLVRLMFNNLEELSSKIEDDPLGGHKVWRVRLREDARWQDTRKLTSDDVIFTIQKIQDHSSQSPLLPAWQGVAVKRLSELEVEFNLASAYAFFPDTLRNLYVMPKHLFADVPVANWRLSQYNLEPVGSGPYRFFSYDKQADGFITTYRLEANKDYFREKPYIQSIQLKFYPNPQELTDAFNDARIDAFFGVNPQELENVSRSFQETGFFLPGYYAVFFNQNKHEALQERAVRRALSLAIDRDRLIKEPLSGRGVAMTASLPPFAPGSASQMEATSTSTSTPSDPVQLLEQNGWKLAGDDGIRQKSIQGRTVGLQFQLVVPDVPFLVSSAQQIADDWEAIGVAAEVAVQPLAELSQNAIKNRDYQMLLFGNVMNASFDPFSFWHSSQRFYPGLNLSLYNNSQVDSLVETLRQTFDMTEREKLFGRLQTLLQQDMPAAFLYSPVYPYVANKRILGLKTELIARPADRFAHVNDWYLRTARVFK